MLLALEHSLNLGAVNAGSQCCDNELQCTNHSHQHQTEAAASMWQPCQHQHWQGTQAKGMLPLIKLSDYSLASTLAYT